ncbi:DNA-binding transcriptional LysR family regulator [Crossiella equi]|uniref:DNA-binding transcriptional LysR family regulator n=1 Tax=Crossiella equi TaxID=130796 RepID=A0ABS5A6Z1_9PSEU|nr:LysR family transcriptional regulator [Crossiella equi]MBP2472366.1 DNA-binding transcriptional LysR family regulator [Crossiella equi]
MASRGRSLDGPGPLEAEDNRAFAPRSLHKIDFNLMIPLHALLVEVNVTRAAERTMVGQPAMSASLSRLRKHFGDELLVRNGRALELTPFASSLVEPVTEVLEQMHAVMGRNAEVDPASMHRTFSVVTSDYVSIVLLKKLLAVLAELAPQVRLEILQPAEGLVTTMRRTSSDFVIAPSGLIPAEFEHFGSVHLFDDDTLMAVDRNNTRVGDRITVEELSRQRMLVFEVQQEGLPWVNQARTTVSTSAGYFTVTMQLLAGSQMSCLVQRKLFDLYGEAVGLREVEVADLALPVLRETLYWHPRHTGDPEHRWVRQKLVEIAATL